MWKYCANCDDLVRKTAYVEGEGYCCLGCAERFGVKKEFDDDFDFDFFEEEKIVEPPTYAALAEMQGRRL